MGGQWAGPPEDCGRPQAFLDRRASAPWRVRELLDDLLEGVKARDTEALDYCLEELRPWQEWLMLHRFDRRRSQSSASAICARHAEVNELKERMTVTKLGATHSFSNCSITSRESFATRTRSAQRRSPEGAHGEAFADTGLCGTQLRRTHHSEGGCRPGQDERAKGRARLSQRIGAITETRAPGSKSSRQAF